MSPAANSLAVLERQLEPLKPRFAAALAGAIPVEKLMQTVMVSVERLPALLNCDRQSVLMAAMSAACLGLQVDGVTGQAFLIPFKGRAQLVIGYKGLSTLAARAGVTIQGDVVCENDAFDFQKGTGAFVRHKPRLENRGRIIAAWASAEHRVRPPVVEVLGIEELMAVKAKSPGAKRGDSPWNDPQIGFPAMCAKTAKRRLWRSLPLTTDMGAYHAAARMDEAVDEQGKPAWITPDRGLEIDGEAADPIGPYEDSPTPNAAQLTAPRPSPGTAAYSSYVDDVLAGVSETPASIKAWWNSDQQKAERRALGDPQVVAEITARVKARLAEMKAEGAAA